MKTQETQGCTQTPISWLELERYVLGESMRGHEIDEHLAACSACESALQRIRQDERSMPGLTISVVDDLAAKRRFSWRPFSWNYLLALAPLAVLLMVLSLRTGDPESVGSGAKGIESSFVLVRENASRILQATHFSQGDRFKVFVTCAPSAKSATFVDLVVQQDGVLSYPLLSVSMHCGNQIAMPGAFSLEGGAARVCILIATQAPPARGSIPASAMCLEVLPES